MLTLLRPAARSGATGVPRAFVRPATALWLVLTVSRAALGDGAAAEPAANIFESTACTTPVSPLDKIVGRRLAKLGIQPACCSDAVFVRRAFLDVIGTLPTAEETRAFLQDQAPHKRQALVDRLLDRPEFADYWAMKWGDLLRIKAEFPVNLWPNAAQAYHHWVRTALRDNQPYDQFVRALLTSNGSNFRVGPVNFYRALQNRTPEGIATAVALTFMGSRAELWPTNTLSGMASFFEQLSYKPTREWKEEIVFWDPDKELAPAGSNAPLPAATNSAVRPAASAAAPAPPARHAAAFPDGARLKRLPPGRDPREVFADWLITPRNPWFTANIVNRIWSWLLGRGIVHEPDDIRPDNPPSNPELLAYLQQELVASRYDLKHIYRLILTSRTYQVTARNPKPQAPSGAALFAFYPLRRLEAEVLIDAINKVTGASDLYTSAIPEPFTFIPENKPAIALPDGSITSPFLELFGRPARATGMENERVNRPVPAQWMHLLNSSHIQRKLEGNRRLKELLKTRPQPQAVIEELYLTILARLPTAAEVQTIEAYTKSGVVKSWEVWTDLSWALINSDEFLYRH
ncbi:MAG: DUF1553 domain-containing protein [Kiritimatiellaeota bacterium]|nr:DUF1553 domain-containing protein [Kiritimatiellota bacterium]